MESQLVSLPVSNAGNNLSPAGTSAWSPTLIFLVGFGATLCLLSAGIFCYSWYRNGRNHRRVCLSHMKAAASVGIEDVHNTTTLDIHSGKMDYDGQLYIPDEQDDEGCSDCVRDTVRHSMHSESSSTIKSEGSGLLKRPNSCCQDCEMLEGGVGLGILNIFTHAFTFSSNNNNLSNSS